MDFKKIVNYGWVAYGSVTTRDVSPHGLSRTAAREKRRINRAAHRKANRYALREGISDREEG